MYTHSHTGPRNVTCANAQVARIRQANCRYFWAAVPVQGTHIFLVFYFLIHFLVHAKGRKLSACLCVCVCVFVFVCVRVISVCMCVCACACVYNMYIYIYNMYIRI
jgi:hypothetical protein